MKPPVKIAITMRTPDHLGGVVAFYKSVLPHFDDTEVACFYLGSKLHKQTLTHTVLDQIRFFTFLNRENPDLIHVNPSLDFKSFIRDGLIIWQAKTRRIPVLVFIHGWQDSFEPRITGMLKWFFNQTYLKADHFIVLASTFKAKLRRWGVKADISLGTTVVDDELLNDFNLDQKLMTRHSRPRILFLARIERKKGIFETLDAINLLLNRSVDLELTIAGDGPALGEAKAYVKTFSQPAQKHISFTGYIRGPKKIEAFKNNDIYCFPTYYGEGMPTSLLEAMAFGMPVVTSPAGGISDFFQNKKMGILVNNQNPAPIATAIEQLISDKNRFSEISRFNHKFAMKHFSSSRAFCLLDDIYKKILKKTCRKT